MRGGLINKACYYSIYIFIFAFFWAEKEKAIQPFLERITLTELILLLANIMPLSYTRASLEYRLRPALTAPLNIYLQIAKMLD